MDKAFYKIEGEKCTKFYLDTYDKLADVNLSEFIELDVIINELGNTAQPNEVIFKDDLLRLKNDVEKRDDMIPDADSKRNGITKSEIIAGFEWPPIDGVVFRMTAENQLNFTNLDRMANKGLLTYPYAIWCGEESVELADEQAVEDFYLMGVSFITQKLNEGKTVRASFRTMTLEELTSWIANNSQLDN